MEKKEKDKLIMNCLSIVLIICFLLVLFGLAYGIVKYFMLKW
jgi:hypothetical protein